MAYPFMRKRPRYAHDHEIAALKNALPGEGDPNAAGVAASQEKMLKVEKNSANRSAHMFHLKI